MDDRVSAAADGMSPRAAVIAYNEVVRSIGRRLRSEGASPHSHDEASGVQLNGAQVVALPTARGRLLTVDEAARYVGVHRNTVYGAARSGRLQARRVGRLVKFTLADLDAWTGAKG